MLHLDLPVGKGSKKKWGSWYQNLFNARALLLLHIFAGKLVRGSHPPHFTHTPEKTAVEFGLWLKKEGYRESTIIRYVKIIRVLSKRATILDGESVKTVIADSVWTEGTKALACDAYGLFAKMKGFTFEKPIYSRVDTLPFIPLEQELDTLISGSGKRTSAFLQILKDTGARVRVPVGPLLGCQI